MSAPHRHIARAPRAFTLLEVLAALALLSLFVAAASSWMAWSARAQRDLRIKTSHETVLTRGLAALQRDLEEAAPGSIQFDPSEHVVACMTAHAADGLSGQLPGPGSHSGWREVRWRLDGRSGELLREERLARSDEAPRIRVVLRGAAMFSVRSIESAEAAPAAPADPRTPAPAPLPSLAHEVTLVLASGQSGSVVWEVER